MEVLKNFVGGSPVDAEAEEELEVPDPATGELLGWAALRVSRRRPGRAGCGGGV